MCPTQQDREHASFRLDDELYLDYQPASEDEPAAWRHDTSSFCDDLIHLREISIQSGYILASIRKHHPDIGHYLALLDKKIDIMAQLVGTIGLGDALSANHRVNLGTDGMRFDGDDCIEAGTPLRLKLVLFPSHLCLHLQARVTSCVPHGQGQRIEVRFEEVGETEHEALIRHLLEKQSAELRKKRER